MRTLLLVLTVLAGAIAGRAAPAADLQPLLDVLLAVGPEGAGHEKATTAWRQLSHADASQLPDMLTALDKAGPLAANWIRTAVDAVAERQLRGGGALPVAGLQRFLADRTHDPQGRRLAYELLLRVDPSAKERWIPKSLDDPSLEMRRDAVARVIAEADALFGQEKKDAAVAAYRRAFTASRSPDQIRHTCGKLRELGQTVDLARHYGFVQRWKVIGPFDNVGEKGYAVAYPPETQIDLDAEYPGKNGEIGWIDFIGQHDMGMVDFNKILAEEKGVIAYATTVFHARGGPREVQFRVTAYSAIKLWLNGRLIDEHNVYHGGSQLDQYVCSAVLKPGANVILVKVCQNEQTQSWAKSWSVQLRVCDERGTAILSTDR